MADGGFGRRVLQARMELAARRGKAMPQVEVARALGVTGTAVSTWESGDKEPDLDTIRRLADVLEVDPGWLAFGPRSDAGRDQQLGAEEQRQRGAG